ncbi:MAG: HEAT repeat domain-containing protein [Planctomycetota bacterium]
MSVLALAGCGGKPLEAHLDSGFRKLFEPRKNPQQNMVVAFSSDDADVRREAVVQVSRSKLYDKEWAIKGFVTLALLDSDEQTRCVAIRALARANDPRATETMLKILNHRDYPAEQIWPPTALCRWDATAALAQLSADGRVPAEQREPVRKTLSERLRSDGERHARIAAARGLTHYPDPETVRVLVGGLRDEDFAVVYQCEDALVRLTGVTHNADVIAWEAWLAEHQGNEFTQAGEIPASRQPPYKNGLEKSVYETRELVEWLWPGKKEK